MDQEGLADEEVSIRSNLANSTSYTLLICSSNFHTVVVVHKLNHFEGLS